MSWVLYLAKTLSPDFFKLAQSTKSVQLVTIGFSHYCELTSWCLKVKGIPFQEQAYYPLQHVLPALAVRVCGKEKYLSSSSRTTEVMDPTLSEAKAAEKLAKEIRKDKKARATAVPVAVCPDGTVWKDSWEIAARSGFEEVDPALKKLLDEEIGPLSRQLAYHYILQPHNTNIWNELLTSNGHWLWRFLWWAFVGSYLRKIMITTMKPYNGAAVADCRLRLNAAFKRTDELIAAKKTRFLGGGKKDSEIGLADIALASLAAPIVLPPENCGGKYTPVFQKLMAQDVALKAEVERYRSTVTGQYILDLYSKHR
jgi:glutathione S-transferase